MFLFQNVNLFLNNIKKNKNYINDNSIIDVYISSNVSNYIKNNFNIKKRINKNNPNNENTINIYNYLVEEKYINDKNNYFIIKPTYDINKNIYLVSKASINYEILYFLIYNNCGIIRNQNQNQIILYNKKPLLIFYNNENNEIKKTLKKTLKNKFKFKKTEFKNSKKIIQNSLNHNYNHNDKINNSKQKGGLREDYFHLYNYQKRVNPFFLDGALRGSLIGLRMQKIALFFTPMDSQTKNLIYSSINSLLDKNSIPGKLFRFFYGDWYLTRVRDMGLWFLINIFRIIPNPVTQSIASSIALNSMKLDLEEKNNKFILSLRKFMFGRKGLFNGCDFLKNFFEKNKDGILPIRATDTLVKYISPKLLPYKTSKDSETKTIFIMEDIDHLFFYMKTELDSFIVKNPSKLQFLNESAENLLNSMIELLSILMTFFTQLDCGINGFLLQLIATKTKPEIVIVFLKQFLKLIPKTIRQILINRENGDNINSMFDKTKETIKNFPDNLEDFFKNIEGVNIQDIKKISTDIKNSGALTGKDTLTDIIDNIFIKQIKGFVEVFYLIVPLLLIVGIIRDYNARAIKQAEINKKKSDEEKKQKNPKLGLAKIQMHTYNIWLIEIQKINNKYLD